MNEILDPLDILALVLDGEASEEQYQQLIEALREDESLRREASKLAAIHGQLGVVMEDEVSRERRVMQISAEVQKVDSDQFENGVRMRLVKRRKLNQLWAIGSVAAVLAIGLFSLSFFKNSQSGHSMEQRSIVATLKHTDGVQWVGSSVDLGKSLLAGQSLQIQSGLLELDLAGRGRLIIEGPARLNFPEDGLAVLHQGRIVMRATEQGHGYRIETPQGSIIDLGTEFGVSVSDRGLVETHVIDGSVEAIPKIGNPVTLTRDEALSMNSEGGQSITADAGKFYTLMPPTQESTPQQINWSFNENQGLLSRAKGELATEFVQSSQTTSDMIFHVMDQGEAPAWIEGVSGSALYFDGKGAYAESAFLGIGGTQARSVCFWVNVPKDFDRLEGFGIVSWGRYKELGDVWQVSANPLLKDGPIGRLRLGLHGGQIIGSTDLRDSQWHHIAVVMYGGSQPNVGTHVILYVDGHQEQVSRRALQEVHTEVKEARHGVWLGRNVTFTSNASTAQNFTHGKFFRGGIDELSIFDSALSQEQIIHLMEQAHDR